MRGEGMNLGKSFFAIFTAISLAGCAGMQKSAEKRYTTFADVDVCNAWHNDANLDYQQLAAQRVAEDRGMDYLDCAKLLWARNSNARLCEANHFFNLKPEDREAVGIEIANRNLNCDAHLASIERERREDANRRVEGYKALSEFGKQLSSPPSSLAPNYGAPSVGQYRGIFQSSYVDGINRICVYDRYGSRYVETISSAQLCPF
ncbi:MAG: hypothetical protein C0422_05000 [Alcaligenaceae bacterium]|nr:hypothetical protein [Alcaligenaceae bacterium]